MFFKPTVSASFSNSILGRSSLTLALLFWDAAGFSYSCATAILFSVNLFYEIFRNLLKLEPICDSSVIMS